MITIQLEIEIQAQPEIVFDLLADHTKQPLWHPYITEGRLYTEGPIQNGSKGITVGTFQGRRVENEIIYYEYDRPRFVSGGTTSGSVVAKMAIEFIPTGNGTQIDYRLEVGFKGLLRADRTVHETGTHQAIPYRVECVRRLYTGKRLKGASRCLP